MAASTNKKSIPISLQKKKEMFLNNQNAKSVKLIHLLNYLLLVICFTSGKCCNYVNKTIFCEVCIFSL